MKHEIGKFLRWLKDDAPEPVQAAAALILAMAGIVVLFMAFYYLVMGKVGLGLLLLFGPPVGLVLLAYRNRGAE